MIELPEIDEEIYQLFGGTDLIEVSLNERGYQWTDIAKEFAIFLTDTSEGSIFE